MGILPLRSSIMLPSSLKAPLVTFLIFSISLKYLKSYFFSLAVPRPSSLRVYFLPKPFSLSPSSLRSCWLQQLLTSSIGLFLALNLYFWSYFAFCNSLEPLTEPRRDFLETEPFSLVEGRLRETLFINIFWEMLLELLSRILSLLSDLSLNWVITLELGPMFYCCFFYDDEDTCWVFIFTSGD